MSTLVENKQIPKCPKLSVPAISDLQHYINTIEILLSTLGLKCFQIKETQSDSVFICKDKYGNSGEGEYLEDGFMLYKGAKCNLELHEGTKSLPMRDVLIQDGTLKKSGDHYVLQSNKIFSSVSSASSIVLGRRSNGWTEWKDSNGKTLDELKR